MASETETIRVHREQSIRGRKECLKDIREHGIKYASKKYGEMLDAENFKTGLAARFFRNGYRITLIGVSRGTIAFGE